MENTNPTNDPPFDILDTKVQKQSHLDKLAAVFLPEDLESMGNRIMSQVIIPNILKAGGDILHKSIDLIFGTNYTGTNQTTPSHGGAQNWTTYNTLAQQQPVGTMQVLAVRKGVYDYSEVRFRTEQDAQNVVNNMRITINNTGRCSVGKYLEFANARTIPEDYNYGWIKLDRTDVYTETTNDPQYPVRIVFPSPLYLNNQTQRRYI